MMHRILRTTLWLPVVTLLAAPAAFAAHPLLTDDTGMQGTGKFQFELTGERGHESADDVTTIDTLLAPALTYGVTDSLDIAIGVPWLKHEEDAAGEKASFSGATGMFIAAKWRFMEKDGLSLALKPFTKLPTGDETKGLGTGKPGYGLTFISTKDVKPFAVHANIGYLRLENTSDYRRDIWQVSLAGEFAATESLRLVADVGIRKNEDNTSVTHPGYILAGIIYALTEDIDLDIGYKGRMNSVGPDTTILAGITVRFGGGGEAAGREAASPGKNEADASEKKGADAKEDADEKRARGNGHER